MYKLWRRRRKSLWGGVILSRAGCGGVLKETPQTKQRLDEGTLQAALAEGERSPSGD